MPSSTSRTTRKSSFSGGGARAKNTALRIHLGNFYVAHGKKDKAEAVFRRRWTRIRRTSRHWRPGRLLHRPEEVRRRLKYTENILKLNPKSQEGMLLKGGILLNRNEFDQALLLFQAYAKDNPKDAMPHYFIALAMWAARRSPGESALAEAIS